MAKFTLLAKSALGGVSHKYGDVSISEVTDCAIVSLASPLEGMATLSAAVSQAYQVDLPAVGAVAEAATVRFLGLQRDQWFVLLDGFMAEHPGAHAVSALADQLGDVAYLTEQSDSWALLRVAGADSIRALERICPVDLHPAAFAPGSVARTVMEHMGVIILCEAEDQYLLLTARSSAGSCLHALQVSAQYIS